MIGLLFDVRPPTSPDSTVGLVLLAIVIAVFAVALLLGFVMFLKFMKKRRAKLMISQAHRSHAREVGYDNCREVAPHRSAPHFVLVSKCEPKQNALGHGCERFGYQKIDRSRRVGEQQRQNEGDDRISAGG